MQINEEARVKLLDAIDGLSDEELNRRPTDGGWSIGQIIEHLYLMEGSIAKTIQHQLANGPIQETAAKPIDRTIDRSVKVDAPVFAVPTEDFVSSQELKAKLTASHTLLRQLAETVQAEQLESKAYPHPIFGDMSLKQWIPFVGYHELRHIEQLVETKDAVSNR